MSDLLLSLCRWSLKPGESGCGQPQFESDLEKAGRGSGANAKLVGEKLKRPTGAKSISNVYLSRYAAGYSS